MLHSGAMSVSNLYIYIYIYCLIFKIIPCVKDDRSDCQTEASSPARTLNTGHDNFYYTESRSSATPVYVRTVDPVDIYTPDIVVSH